MIQLNIKVYGDNMGTRGIYGFHKDGVDKLTYNHFDSYPEGLGDNIVNSIKILKSESKNNKEFMYNLTDIFNNIQMVDENKPIPSGLGTTETEWYYYLRRYQGDIKYFIDKHSNNEPCYMINKSDFINDSLFCEWGYIINLTTNKFEIYEGNQTSPTSKHRYYIETPTMISSLGNNYYNCELVKEYPLTKIPKEWFKKL